MTEELANHIDIPCSVMNVDSLCRAVSTLEGYVNPEWARVFKVYYIPKRSDDLCKTMYSTEDTTRIELRVLRPIEYDEQVFPETISDAR